jgi:hypothetical protein
MSLTVTFGTFAFPPGEPTVTQSRQVSYEDNGDAAREVVSTTIEGKYTGSSTDAYEAQMNAFLAAMDQNQASFTVSYGGTNTVAHLSVGGTACLVGPRCTSRSFPEGGGAELASAGMRTYSATIEWERELTGTSRGNLLKFQESISFNRGEAVKQVVNTINGTALIFTTCAKPAYEAKQTGEAIGRTSYPTPPPALWPNDLFATEPFTRESPEFVRLSSDGSLLTSRVYKIGWGYSFASGTDFSGSVPVPHTWGTQV